MIHTQKVYRERAELILTKKQKIKKTVLGRKEALVGIVRGVDRSALRSDKCRYRHSLFLKAEAGAGSAACD